MIYGHKVDRLKLQSAKVQGEASKCALQLMSCLFSAEELVNGNPSGNTNSKDEMRRKTIQKLDPKRIQYISGMYNTFVCILLPWIYLDYIEKKWPNSFDKVLKMTQKCTDFYHARKELRHTS